MLLIHSGYSQTATVQPLSSDVQKDLSLWLKPGIHVADVMGRKQPTAREYQLLGKVMRAMQTNRVWFTDTLPNLPPKQLVDSLQKLGLTKKEYDEYNELSDRRDSAIVLGRDTLEIIRRGNIISFKGRNRLKSLDSVKIDLAGKLVLYGRGRDSLPYSGVITIDQKSKDKNPFLSASPSYKFSLIRQLSDANALATGDWHSLSVTDMALTIGRVENTHKTMLLLMASKITNGKAQLAVVVPIVFE
jgi:hypothetical protein